MSKSLQPGRVPSTATTPTGGTLSVAERGRAPPGCLRVGSSLYFYVSYSKFIFMAYRRSFRRNRSRRRRGGRRLNSYRVSRGGIRL